MADVTPVPDVIVLGSGVAGLMAALSAHERGATVEIHEKSDLLGGTSAMSGGIVWMPNNHLQADEGIEDSRAGALQYLDALSLGHIDSDMAAAFVDEGPPMLQWVHDQTPCEFKLLTAYPDYHPEHPGGLAEGGRSVDLEPFAFGALGDWAARVRRRAPTPLSISETPLGGATEMPPMEVIGARMANDENAMGLGLVGALLTACLERGIEPKLSSRATGLIIEDGRVVGVRLDEHEVRCSGGVVLATGGFEWDDELTRTFLRGPMTAPAGSPDNTGDGLVMAMEAGARLGNMHGAWWVPITRVPGEEMFGKPTVSLILVERTRPGSLMVNSTGRRFCNEAGNYNAMGGVFHQFDPISFDYPNLPAWLIFDHAHRQRYDVVRVSAGAPSPDWMPTADTIEELAVLIDVDPTTLRETVDRFNEHAAEGRDPDFGRGESAYDRFNGDQSLPGVKACLGPLTGGPYSAIQIESGTLGTNGGPKTDTRCRVLANRGGLIDGLYAAGNAMAAPTGLVYGGAGGTIGPAMTFGWIAGREAAANA